MISLALNKSLPDSPWENWVKRVILHVTQYMSPDGEPKSGGLQRNVRDIAKLIREEWGRDCVIVQKATSNWEREDQYGTPVIGIKATLSVYGDPGFGRITSKMIGKGDAIIYMGGEDAWPYILIGAKGFHAGIWWDGPLPNYKKWITGKRTESLFRACRSVLCVDTNVINWLRARSRKNQGPANRAIYIPNSVDLKMLPSPVQRVSPAQPFRLLFARRYEKKRGPDLALDAVALLHQQGFPVQLIMSTAQGQAGTDAILTGARERGITSIVEAHENDMDSVFNLYREADAAIVPTIWSEGTSYSCVEALAAGLPVVTTTVGGLPNLVVPGVNGYVVPPQPENIARAIVEVAEPSNWVRLHTNCLAMRESLSNESWEQRVLNWLKS